MEQPVTIKEVIETLSVILHQHGLSKVAPEIFRKAKHNKCEVSTPLLHLVSEILIRLGKVESRKCCDKFYLLLSVLKEGKYERLGNILASGQHNLSSRELLLALGFILIRFDFLNVLRMECTDILPRFILDSMKVKESACMFSDTYKLTEIELDDLVILRKKVESSFRSLRRTLCWYENLLQKYDKVENVLLKELNDNPTTLKFKHVSTFDVLVQSDIKLQKQLIEALQKQNVLLKLHCKWLQNESLFWKWMTSVVNGASIAEESSAAEQGVHEKLFLHILFFDSSNFREIYRKFSTNSSNSLEEVNHNPNLFSVSDFLCKTMMQSSKTDTKARYESKEGFDEMEKLRERTQKLKEDCKVWLRKYLMCNFPNLIQLRSPRR